MYGSPFSLYGLLYFGSTCAPASSASFGASHYGLDWYGYEPQHSLYGLGHFGLNCYGSFPQVHPVKLAHLLGWEVRMKLGKPEQFATTDWAGIWQMRMTKSGKRPLRMKFYRPSDPKTIPQQANRNKFRDAMTAWQSLTEEQKKAYDVRARRLQMFGRNLFIREYYSLNP